MTTRARREALRVLLLRAGWQRDGALAAATCAERDAASAEATVRAVERAFASGLESSRAESGARVAPDAMLRGLSHLAVLERLRALARERHVDALAVAKRRRDDGRAAQARVDAYERRRATDRLAERAESDRRAGLEIDRHWLAAHHRPPDPGDPSP